MKIKVTYNVFFDCESLQEMKDFKKWLSDQDGVRYVALKDVDEDVPEKGVVNHG